MDRREITSVKGPDYPIYFVSYSDAEEFCRRLTAAGDEMRGG